MGLNDSDAELENLRQQLRFASTRLEEERAGHKGTLRLLEESRRERERLAQEVEDWQERAGRAGDSDEKEQAVARLAELEATVAEQRAELEARNGELAAGAEVQTQLAAEAGRLEKELQALRDEHAGSKDAIAALTAQVDELRAGTAERGEARVRGCWLRRRSQSFGKSFRVARTPASSSRRCRSSARRWLAWSRFRRSGRPR